MKKIIILSLILFIFVTGCKSIDVIQDDPSELYEYSLEQKEVKSHLGTQEIESYEVSPAVALAEEGPTYPDIYKVIFDTKPSCFDDLKLGDPIKFVRIHTPNRNIDVVYSTENNKLLCTTSYDPLNYN